MTSKNICFGKPLSLKKIAEKAIFFIYITRILKKNSFSLLFCPETEGDKRKNVCYNRTVR